MQTTSATYDRILAGTEYGYETRLIIDGVGTFQEGDLFGISTNIEMFQQDPEIGRAISGEVNVSMLNPSATIPTMAKIRPQVRACGTAPKSSKVTIVDEDLASEYASYSNENITFSSASGATVVGETLSFAVDSSEYLESEWLAQGVYFIDTRETTQNNNGLDVLSLHGFDAMLKTEQIYSSNSAVGDDLDIAYVRAIASAIGVTVDNRTWEIMQTGYMIPFPLGYSMREILGYIASAYAGCFIISDTGQLRLVALEDIESETRYLIDEIGNIIVFGTNSPEHTVTASGAVATFTAGGEYALDELEVAIEPVQDLHGQTSPYPAGGSKNRLPITLDNLKTNNTSGTWTGNTYSLNNVKFEPIIDNGGNVTAIKVTGTASTETRFTCGTYISDGTSVIANGCPSGGSTSTYRTFTTNIGSDTGSGTPSPSPSSGTSCVYTIRIYANYNANLTFYPMIRGSGESDTFVPYENICPISGWTGMDIYQSDNAPQTFIDGKYYNDNGNLTNSANTRYEEAYIPVSVDKRYTFKFGATSTNRLRVHEYDSNQTRLRQIISTPVSTTEISYKPSDDASYIRFSYPIACNTVNLYVKEISISWQDEAGTVYKGTLNVKTGVLTALWTMVTETSSSGWTGDAGNQRAYKYYAPIKSITDLNDKVEAISNYLVAINQPQGITQKQQGMFMGAINAKNVSVHINGVTDKSSASAIITALGDYFASNPWQFCYALATPVTYQLSPTQVKTLLDQNNLWANTGNIINLEFVEPATEAVRILV